MKLLLFACIIICPFFSCSSQNFLYLSKQIDKKCRLKPNPKVLNFHDLRKILYKDRKLDLFDKGSDTLYILESHSAQDGIYRSKIWNHNGNIEFVYSKSGFRFDEQQIFTDYTIRLIQAWDTSTIRKEEKLYSNFIPVRFIWGIRVIRGKKNIIECITFKEFFNPKDI